jgi:hypothetical protein
LVLSWRTTGQGGGGEAWHVEEGKRCCCSAAFWLGEVDLLLRFFQGMDELLIRFGQEGDEPLLPPLQREAILGGLA